MAPKKWKNGLKKFFLCIIMMGFVEFILQLKRSLAAKSLKTTDPNFLMYSSGL